MSHAIAGARGTVKDREAVLKAAQAWGADRGSEILLADASVVFGPEHLESAAFHAERARDARLMATRSVSMEALLYLAGERQVADAIRVAGITESTTAIAVGVFGTASVDELIAQVGWHRDDGVLAAEGKDLGRLGISNAERGTVAHDRIVDLALERTAMLDVNK